MFHYEMCHYQNEGEPNFYVGNANWNNMSFSEDSYSFRCFQSDGEFMLDSRHIDRESSLNFVLGTIC